MVTYRWIYIVVTSAMNKYLFRVNFQVGHVSFENRWDISLRELILAKDVQQTRLSACAVTHGDELFAYRRHDVPEEKRFTANSWLLCCASK